MKSNYDGLCVNKDMKEPCMLNGREEWQYF